MSKFESVVRRSAMTLALLAGSNALAACNGDSEKAEPITSTQPTATEAPKTAASTAGACKYERTAAESERLGAFFDNLTAQEDKVLARLQPAPATDFVKALARIAEVGTVAPNPKAPGGTPVELTVVTDKSYDVHVWYREDGPNKQPLTNKELVGLLPAEIKVFETGTDNIEPHRGDGAYTINDSEYFDEHVDGKVDALGRFGGPAVCIDSFDKELAYDFKFITARTAFLPEAQDIYTGVIVALAAGLGE